jgi:hypothetical protein
VLEKVKKAADSHYLTIFYGKVINKFGQFRQEAIELGLGELR